MRWCTPRPRRCSPTIRRSPTLHTIDRGWKKQGSIAPAARRSGRCIGRCAQRRYDLLVHLTEHPRGLTLATLLRPAFAVTRERDEREHAWLWRRAFTHFYPLPKARAAPHGRDQSRRAAPPRHPSRRPKTSELVHGARARRAEARVDAMLARARTRARSAFVQVHPGSRWLFKCWPAGRMAALARASSSSDGFRDRRHRRAGRARARDRRRRCSPRARTCDARVHRRHRAGCRCWSLAR